MKKGSTSATKQSRNISQQKLTIGLDLGEMIMHLTQKEVKRRFVV